MFKKTKYEEYFINELPEKSKDEIIQENEEQI